jgi:calcineurin-like phosphoesterase family protein
MGHNEIMVKRWHETVTDDDVVLHLGDVVFTRDKEKNDRFFDEIGPNLPGDKYLILGNHVTHSFGI